MTASYADSLRRRIQLFSDTGAVVRLQALQRGRHARLMVVHSVRAAFEALVQELEVPFIAGHNSLGGASSSTALLAALASDNGHTVRGEHPALLLAGAARPTAVSLAPCVGMPGRRRDACAPSRCGKIMGFTLWLFSVVVDFAVFENDAVGRRGAAGRR